MDHSWLWYCGLERVLYFISPLVGLVLLNVFCHGHLHLQVKFLQKFMAWHSLRLIFGKIGSVSVAIWFAACRRMIKALALTVNDFVLAPAVEKKVAAA